MFIKKMLLLVLALLLIAFLLMACKVPPEERTEADNLEIENIVNEVIEDLDQHSSEEEVPEPEPEPEKETVDISEVLMGMWPFEDPKLSDFGEPLEIYIGRSNIEEEQGFLEFKFWYGPAETAEDFLEEKGPLLFGYVPQQWYHVDVTTAKLKEGVEVTDIGINIQEIDEGFDFYLMINKPKPDEIVKGWSLSYFSEPKSALEHELLTDEKLIYEGINYDVELNVMELFKTWKLEHGELSMVIDWCDVELADQPGFTKTQNEDTKSTLFEFEYLSPTDDYFDVAGEGYDHDDSLWQFRYKVHF